MMGPRAFQKAESEELEVQKPQVKLRRAVSEVARPASTPPIMASAIKDEDDEDRIIAELEVGQGHAWPLRPHPVLVPCQVVPRVRCQDQGRPQDPIVLLPISLPL